MESVCICVTFSLPLYLLFCSLLLLCLTPPSMSFSQLSQHNYIARQLKVRNTIGLMSQLHYFCCLSTHTWKKKSSLKPEIYTISTIARSASPVRVLIPLFFQFPTCFFFFSVHYFLTSTSNFIPRYSQRSTCN